MKICSLILICVISLLSNNYFSQDIELSIDDKKKYETVDAWVKTADGGFAFIIGYKKTKSIYKYNEDLSLEWKIEKEFEIGQFGANFSFYKMDWIEMFSSDKYLIIVEDNYKEQYIDFISLDNGSIVNRLKVELFKWDDRISYKSFSFGIDSSFFYVSGIGFENTEMRSIPTSDPYGANTSVEYVDVNSLCFDFCIINLESMETNFINKQNVIQSNESNFLNSESEQKMIIPKGIGLANGEFYLQKYNYDNLKERQIIEYDIMSGKLLNKTLITSPPKTNFHSIVLGNNKFHMIDYNIDSSGNDIEISGIYYSLFSIEGTKLLSKKFNLPDEQPIETKSNMISYEYSLFESKNQLLIDFIGYKYNKVLFNLDNGEIDYLTSIENNYSINAKVLYRAFGDDYNYTDIENIEKSLALKYKAKYLDVKERGCGMCKPNLSIYIDLYDKEVLITVLPVKVNTTNIKILGFNK